ncbi:hypothetical protein GWK47_021113 [Chionoecetes opilio]|uniref:Uncharacterized protein n=1 Tax=Chionoecetes opilio TaxID=41210 RepID=A0A8J4XPN8_CHIOP|nr:hypothetical protein GWK47_021113 [Chionoecetes opilio]
MPVIASGFSSYKPIDFLSAVDPSPSLPDTEPNVPFPPKTVDYPATPPVFLLFHENYITCVCHLVTTPGSNSSSPPAVAHHTPNSPSCSTHFLFTHHLFAPYSEASFPCLRGYTNQPGAPAVTFLFTISTLSSKPSLSFLSYI